MVAQLDVTLRSLVHRELSDLSERMKEKYWEEREQYWNKLEKQQGELEETAESREDDCKDAEEPAFPSPEVSSTEGKDWQQMLRLVMLLQKEGNFLIAQGKFREASEKFTESIDYVDHLQYKQVDQRGDDWDSLEKVRLPLVLNLSQCLLELQQYQQVVELNNKLLKKHKGNFKAVYQRARAHAALFNEEEARKDFAFVEKLDPKFKPIVRQELKKLGENVRTMHTSQNKNYWATTQEKWGPDGSKAKATAKERKNVKLEQKKSKENEMAQREAEIEKLEDENTGGCDECGRAEGLDNRESVAEDAQDEAANRDTDKDSDPTPTSEAADSVESRRSGGDKATEKGKCQSSAAPEPGRAAEENKDTTDKTGDGGSPLELSREGAAEAVTKEE